MIYVVLGDLHAPFVHRPSITKLLRLLCDLPGRGKRGKNVTVIQLGDAYDFLSYGKWPRKIIDPKQEVMDGRLCLEEIWRAIHKKLPEATKYQLLGNHDIRPLLRIKEKIPELYEIVDLSHLWDFDHVITINDSKEPLILEDKYLFTHGFLAGRPGQHLRHFQNKFHVIFGHTHRTHIHYERQHGGHVKWEFNCGYLADPFDKSDAFAYRPMKKFFTWTQGVGIIDEDGPRFIHF